MRTRLSVLILAAVVAGCGTTVARPRGAGLSPTASDGLTGTAPGSSGTGAFPPGPAQPAGAPGASSGARSPLPPSEGVASGGATGPASVAGAAPVANGPGVTATTITLGITYYENAAGANSAIGAVGIHTVDPTAATKLLVKDINDHGGIDGRHVDALLYPIDPQSATPYATEAQTECAYFTEDHKAFAVIDGSPAVDARDCLNRHGVLELRSPLVTAALASNEVDVDTALTSRVFTALVPALSQQGWFSPWNRQTGQPGGTATRVGVVSVDSPDEDRAVDTALLPALRAVGYPAVDVIRIAPPGGFSDDANAVAAVDNAVLKLNADGVDHVILDDSNASLTLLFNADAATQNYLPRYGGTSGNGWQTLLSAGDIQARTLRGAMGIGWQPLFDLPYQHGDGPDATAARHACFAMFAKNGMAPTDANTAGGEANACDIVYLLPAALHGVAGGIDLTVALSRIAALGTSYPLASSFSSRFGAAQRDGIGQYADLAFDGACSCMTYRSGPAPMPG